MAAQMDSDSNLDMILKKYFSSEYYQDYITIKDVCMPSTHEKYAEAIEEFDVRDDDIWVCSFPKSGTTWTQEMTWCIANNLDFEKGKMSLQKRFPFFEASVLSGLYNHVLTSSEDADIRALTMNSLNYVKELSTPRFVKTHLPFHLLPRQLRTGEKKPRMIYVTRNPKDTCISSFYHYRLLENYEGSFDNFCKLFLGDKLPYAPYWSHVSGYREKIDNRNLLILKYEDMKSDLPAIIKKTTAFLGKTDLTDDQIALLSEHLSFANMKTNPAVNYSELIQLKQKLKLMNFDNEFMRSGEVKQWKTEMTQDMIDLFDRCEKEKLVY